MGRGLSQQQKDILALLPEMTDSMDCADAPTTREIIDRLGLDYTPSNRASVSRAKSRLYDRGLILGIWGFHWGRQRTGYARATPEQVRGRKEKQAQFLAAMWAAGDPEQFQEAKAAGNARTVRGIHAKWKEILAEREAEQRRQEAEAVALG